MTVPVWTLAEDVWCASALVLGVQALTTIVLDRNGSRCLDTKRKSNTASAASVSNMET
jgi:hypothetical protein